MEWPGHEDSHIMRPEKGDVYDILFPRSYGLLMLSGNILQVVNVVVSVKKKKVNLFVIEVMSIK